MIQMPGSNRAEYSERTSDFGSFQQLRGGFLMTSVLRPRILVPAPKQNSFTLSFQRVSNLCSRLSGAQGPLRMSATEQFLAWLLERFAANTGSTSFDISGWSAVFELQLNISRFKFCS